MTQQYAKQLLDRKSVALLAIDFQARLMPAIFDADRVIKNTILLLRASQVLSIPAVLTTQYAHGLGPVVPEVACAIPGLVTLDKISFGCFGDENFPQAFKEAAPNCTTLLIAGVESHVCVTQTVLGALEAGYTVHVAADATSSRTTENRQIGLDRMARAGAIISSTEMMIFELLRRSGTAEFKAMLPLVK
ncbi:MAG: hydrolase [Acidobacteria bacterium]|nr:hydrolase [Acidobacteriota bacterium]